MKQLIRPLVVCGALSSSAAFGGTCADPTPLNDTPPDSPPQQTFSGTTCGGEAGINLGGTVYGHPSQVYTFMNRSSGPVTISGADREVAVATSCTTAPIAVGGPGAPIPNSVLQVGQRYLLIVTTDPSIPLASPPVCGEFSGGAPYPVSLQQFSVD